MRREWIEITLYKDYGLRLYGLPPCGGSGLKSLVPSVSSSVGVVSLHAEGVD